MLCSNEFPILMEHNFGACEMVAEETGLRFKKLAADGQSFLPAEPPEKRPPTVKRNNASLVLELTVDQLASEFSFVKTLVDSIPSPIFVAQEDSSIKYVNPALEKLTGFSRPQLIGLKAPYPWSPPESEPSKNGDACPEDSELEQVEQKYCRKDGQRFWVKTKMKALKQDGVTRYRLWIWEDLTESKIAATRLMEAVRDWQNTFDSISDMVSIQDKEYRLLKVNKAYAATLGRAQEELVGKHCYEVMHGTQCPITGCPHFQTVQNGDSAVASHYEPKLKWHLEISTFPIRDSAGEIAGTVHIARDVTKQKESDDALKKSEASYRNLFETMAQGVVYYGRRGEVTSMNPAAENILGSTLAELSQKSLLESKVMMLREDGSELLNAEHPVVHALESGRAQKDVLIGILNPRDGKYRWLNISAIPEFSPLDQEKPQRVFATFTDLTDRKQAEDETKQAQRDLQVSLYQIRKALQGYVEATVKMVEMRDPYTAGHQQRVARLAVAIADEMGLSPEQVENISMAAQVHDIGKIYVPAEILSRSGEISDLEFSLMRTHAESSYKILNTIAFPGPIAQIAWQHHERMDGSGYPNHLKGEDILIEARIIAVADTVEAMSGHRPYRPSLGVPRALEEISNNKGKLYDPQVVAACVKLFNEKNFTLTEPGGVISVQGPGQLSRRRPVGSSTAG